MKRPCSKETPGAGNPIQSLYNDALNFACELRRRHRALCERDLDAVRKTIRKAHARVIRRKPGPKADPRIGAAARERARGTAWDVLYSRHIQNYAPMPDSTRDDAESGFRRKVNSYLQRHPVLRRKLRKRGGGTSSGDSVA